MLRFLVFVAALLTSAPPALALDFPARTPGLWELEITPDVAGYILPPQRAETRKPRQCIDATVDQLLWQRDLGGEMVDLKLCRANIGNSNGTITADLSCDLDVTSFTAHMVISGDFTSAYTMDLTSTQAPIRGAALPQLHVTISYKYVGPCEADQQPGDFITPEGTKMHLFGGSKPLDQP